MTYRSDRPLGLLFGLLGAALLVLDGIFDFFKGAFFLATHRAGASFSSLDQSIVFIVVGLIAGFFAILGRSRWGDESLAAGIILVVMAVVGWLALGFASGVLAILASLCLLISGILFLVAKR
ncbi:MAG: hypothetical protein WB778_02230 [Thermoplasmata archaeon]